MSVLLWGDGLDDVEAALRELGTTAAVERSLTREALLTSVRAVLPGPVLVAGRGRAGVAALSLGVNARRLGIQVALSVAVEPDLAADDPLSGQPLRVGPRGGGTTTLVVVGTAVPEEWTTLGWDTRAVPATSADDLARIMLG